MKTKNKLHPTFWHGLLILTMGICLSCDHSPDNPKTITINPNLLIGEWFCEDVNGGFVTDLTLDNLQLSGSIYQNMHSTPEEIDHLSGSWTYSANSGVLAMQIFRKSEGGRSNVSYIIPRLDSLVMHLRNQENGVEDKYLRIVETHKVHINEEFDIDHPLVRKGATCSSKYNNGIVKVQQNGHVKASGKGITFITLNSSTQKAVIKVVVEDIVEKDTTVADGYVDIQVSPSNSILGQWLEDVSNDDVQLMMYTNYKTDGTVDIMSASISVYSSELLNYSAKYTYNNSSLTLNYKEPRTGNNVTDVYSVRSIDAFSMTLFYALTSVTEQTHRIVHAHPMNVNENVSFRLNMNGVNLPVSKFNSNNPTVAAVDAQGNVHALRRGFTFISMTTARGTAVVRVDVSDPDHVIDDFTSYLGASLDEAIKTYGKTYIDGSPQEGIHILAYNLLDELIESVAFYYDESRVIYDIVLSLREGADFNAILQSYRQKYRDISDPKDPKIFMFLYDRDDKTISIGVNVTRRLIGFDFK